MIAAIALSHSIALADGLSALERLGRQIYKEGKGDAPVQALLGSSQTAIAASVVPCASCHGDDGRGRPEGGVVPAEVTAAALGAALDSGPARVRTRVAYTDRLLARAITMGIDSSANRLDAMMPRYQISLKDMAALTAYLKKLGDLRDPGLTADTIRIGVLLPPKEHLASVADAVRNALQAFVDARDKAGGIYDRKIELVFADCDGSPSQRADAAASFIATRAPFALVGSFTDGADDELAAVARDHAIPLLATISSRAESVPSNRYVRGLVAGIRDQTRALAQFIGRRFPSAHVAVLHDERSKAVAEAAADELKKLGVRAELRESGVAPASLKESGIDAVLYAGAPEALAKLSAATRELTWSPAIFVSSALIHPDVLDRTRTAARFYVALPIGPDDQTPAAVEAWRQLVGKEGARVHQPMQFAALASAQVLFAALEHVGRELTRGKLLAAIDGITALETGLVPPLTYNRSRHIGSTGSYIVAITEEPSDGQRIVWVDPG